jgi:hypothetical protein
MRIILVAHFSACLTLDIHKHTQTQQQHTHTLIRKDFSPPLSTAAAAAAAAAAVVVVVGWQFSNREGNEKLFTCRAE